MSEISKLLKKKGRNFEMLTRNHPILKQQRLASDPSFRSQLWLKRTKRIKILSRCVCFLHVVFFCCCLFPCCLFFSFHRISDTRLKKKRTEREVINHMSRREKFLPCTVAFFVIIHVDWFCIRLCKNLYKVYSSHT